VPQFRCIGSNSAQTTSINIKVRRYIKQQTTHNKRPEYRLKTELNATLRGSREAREIITKIMFFRMFLKLTASAFNVNKLPNNFIFLMTNPYNQYCHVQDGTRDEMTGSF
jgi:hypothetical protein